ncbi:unnamed protein product [Ectocarpus sp. CCAP 1310/34]|nr:unnamed protein product [Ectocarpus sp. CCAP 1310/34]
MLPYAYSSIYERAAAGAPALVCGTASTERAPRIPVPRRLRLSAARERAAVWRSRRAIARLRGAPRVCIAKMIETEKVRRQEARAMEAKKGPSGGGEQGSQKTAEKKRKANDRVRKISNREKHKPRVGSWNVYGFERKRLEIVDQVEQSDLDVVGIQESWELKDGDVMKVFRWKVDGLGDEGTRDEFQKGLAGSVEPFRKLLRSVEDGQDPTAGALDADAGSFLRLSLTLFEGRQKSPKSSAEASDASRGREVDGHLDSVQVVRVPQTGSRHLSTVARRLVGCPVKSSFVISGGPKCRFPGDIPLGCPDDSLLCPKVIGFMDNAVDREVLADATVVSLSQLRSPLERIMSAYFVGGKPHSPPCARRSGQTRREVQECFAGMVDSQGFRNVAGRTYTGHDAYDSGVSVCYSPRNSSSSRDGDGKHHGLEGYRGGAESGGAEPNGLVDGSGSEDDEDGGDAAGGDVGNDCQETLGAALAGLCLFNHITLAFFHNMFIIKVNESSCRVRLMSLSSPCLMLRFFHRTTTRNTGKLLQRRPCCCWKRCRGFDLTRAFSRAFRRQLSALKTPGPNTSRKGGLICCDTTMMDRGECSASPRIFGTLLRPPIRQDHTRAAF